MWFKQAQIFKFSSLIPSDVATLETQLEALAFRPCLPSLPSSLGWISPVEEEGAPLVETIPHYFMICLQFEEKILPATVVRQKLKEQVEQRELNHQHKVSFKEKQSLKDEITQSLLSKAFTKLTRVYAHIDIKDQWLIINTTNPKKTESFISILKRCIQQDIQPLNIKKPAPIMAQWLTGNTSRLPFEIEKSCVLQDPNQQRRMIRCQEQNLFDKNIQALIKDGYEVKQLALAWQDRIKFVLSDDLSLRSITYQNELIATAKEDAETKAHKFAVEFILMADILSQVFTSLRKLFVKDGAPARLTGAKEGGKAVSVVEVQK